MGRIRHWGTLGRGFRVKPAPLRSGLLLDKSGMDSLDTEVDEDAEEAWRVEIRRRLEEIDRGAAKLVP